MSRCFGAAADRMHVVLGRPGGDLLSRVLGRSTIGAEGFHGRVRDGIGCIAPRNDHQVVEEPGFAALRRARPGLAVSVVDRVSEVVGCAEPLAAVRLSLRAMGMFRSSRWSD